MNFSDINDTKGLCRNVPKRGNGQIEISFNSIDQLDDVKNLIEQYFKLYI